MLISILNLIYLEFLKSAVPGMSPRCLPFLVPPFSWLTLTMRTAEVGGPNRKTAALEPIVFSGVI